MSYEDVSVQLRKVMDIAEDRSSFSINEIEEAINNGLSALEFNPKGRFDDVLSHRITRWVEKNWSQGNNSFLDGAISLYVNFASKEKAKTFFITKLQTDHRPFVQKELKDALENDLY